ncbi:MAG: GNAT family N-acetyltransferase [Actinomycetota bacterium]
MLEEDGSVIGFYELRDRCDHVELLRMFLLTELIGQGYGKVLWDHAVEQASVRNDRMLIKSDRWAVGFYSAMGARLEKRQEVAPGFSLGIFWYDLAEGPEPG